jgi:hypothetical protein
MPGNHDRFALFYQFEQLRETGFGFMNIDLHAVYLRLVA